MTTTKEIARVASGDQKIYKTLNANKIVFSTNRWRKFHLANESRQRYAVSRIPISEAETRVYNGDMSLYTQYYLSGNEIILTGKSTYGDESVTTFYDNDYYGKWYEYKKRTSEEREYDDRSGRTRRVTYIYTQKVAELKVVQESYYVIVKGSYIETVYSSDRKKYPENGVKGSYWYEVIK